MELPGESFLRNAIRWIQRTSQRVTKFAAHPFTPYPHLRRLELKWKHLVKHPGYRLRCYIVNLGLDEGTEFYQNINSFLECTKESYERDATVVLTNVRQFITGMKNYLHESGGKTFDQLILKAKQEDTYMTFDLDDILESVLYELVVEPLHDFIIEILADECYYGVVDMIENSKDICQYTLQELGLKLEPFSDDLMLVMRHYFQKMKMERNPLDKWDYFLGAITVMLKSVVSSETGEHTVIFADEFIPLLVWMLANCGVVTGEMETLYMWCLVNPIHRQGEFGYYFTSLMCAISVLKEPERLFEMYRGKPKYLWQTEVIEQDRYTMRILVPDEYSGIPNVIKVLRGQPGCTASQICQTMARKLHTRNPELYGLFKLVNGEAYLMENDMKLIDGLIEEVDNGNHVYFLYMPTNLRVTWPLNTPNSSYLP